MVRLTSSRLTIVIAAFLATVVSPHAAVTDRQAELDDAFVELDHSSARWTIGNDRVTYAVGISHEGAFQLHGLRIAGSDDVLTTGDEPDALVTIAGRTIRLGAPDSHLDIERVDAATGPHFVSMSVRQASEVFDVVATRHYVVYPHAAAVEMWTEFDTRSGDTRAIDNLNAYALTVPQGTVDSIAGLDAAAEDGGAFTRRSRNLVESEAMDLGSNTLSSEGAVPYFRLPRHARRRVFTRLAERRGQGRADLPGRSRGARVGARAAHAIPRRGRSRQPEVGRQPRAPL